jgi:hypothetical protein
MCKYLEFLLFFEFLSVQELIGSARMNLRCLKRDARVRLQNSVQVTNFAKASEK